jgi:hypothetical protein
MSTDYYMVCTNCKEAIHIAQDGMSGFTFYSGEKNCMKEYKVFIKNHIGHSLTVLSENKIDHDDYKEIEWENSVS